MEGLCGSGGVLEGDLSDGKPKETVIPEGRAFGLFVDLFPVVEILLKEGECVVGLLWEIEQGEVVSGHKDLTGDAPIVTGLCGPVGMILCSAQGFLVGGMCGLGVSSEEGGVTDPEPKEGIAYIGGDFFDVAGGFADQTFPCA